jgi:hypothetical protein
VLRIAAVLVNALGVITGVILLWLILLEQREQSRELARLTNCVYILQDRIGPASAEPVRGCPIE